MRSFFKVAALLALMVTAVHAETPPSVLPHDTVVKLILLRQKSVQEELKIEKELAKLIHEFTVLEHEEHKKALSLSGEAKEAKYKELEKANEAFLTEKLTPAQRKRLEQIAIQVTGLRHLMKPEVAKVLSLTPEQKETVKKMYLESQKTFREVVDADKVENRNEKLAELRAKIYDKIVELLTEKQREIAREYVGERFKGAIIVEEPEGGKDK